MPRRSLLLALIGMGAVGCDETHLHPGAHLDPQRSDTVDTAIGEPPVQSTQVDAECGNGRVEVGEQCDDGVFVPSVDIELEAIVPDVYDCNGPCYYELEIRDGSSVIASGCAQGATQTELTSSRTGTLLAGQSDTFDQHAWTDRSVGIYTAGSTIGKPCNPRTPSRDGTRFLQSGPHPATGIQLRNSADCPTGSLSYFGALGTSALHRRSASGPDRRGDLCTRLSFPSCVRSRVSRLRPPGRRGTPI